MLRQPSQSVSFSVPRGTISGLMNGTGNDSGLLRLVGRVFLHAGDEDAHALVHLRGGEADAVILLHRVDHVVDELLDGRGLEVRPLERTRPPAQDGMSHARHLEDGHVGGLYRERARCPRQCWNSQLGIPAGDIAHVRAASCSARLQAGLVARAGQKLKTDD